MAINFIFAWEQIDLMRYFFQVSYHGRNYHGWQIQKNAITVQQVINESLATIFGYPVKTIGSGRTDTGVHASGQVFQADFLEPIEGGRSAV